MKASIHLRLAPELRQQIVDRADERGISLNEWIVRACAIALARKDTAQRVTIERIDL